MTAKIIAHNEELLKLDRSSDAQNEMKPKADSKSRPSEKPEPEYRFKSSHGSLGPYSKPFVPDTVLHSSQQDYFQYPLHAHAPPQQTNFNYMHPLPFATPLQPPSSLRQSQTPPHQQPPLQFIPSPTEPYSEPRPKSDSQEYNRLFERMMDDLEL